MAQHSVEAAGYRLDDVSDLPSPALVIFRDRLRGNLRSMIELAGGPDRLRPHVKTHKMPAIVKMVEESGIHKHKCATIAEAEMIARAGGRDILVAYPMVGPNLGRLATLAGRYPSTTFRATVDAAEPAERLSEAIEAAGLPPLATLVDVDLGMGRTGIDPDRAYDLYGRVHDLPGLAADGLHAYDGHRREPDPEARRRAAWPGVEAVLALRERLEAAGRPVPRLVLGGSPTFPIHATVEGPGVECSPGTVVLHDGSYAAKFPDLPFTPAALLLTRVVSRPRAGRVCLDVGSKAVAADPAGDRLTLLGVPGATLGPQSEEHLVVETPTADGLPPGTPLLALPTHICPTCALHREAIVVEGGKVVGRWEVVARDRVLAANGI